MPSADMRTTMNSNSSHKGPEFNVSSIDVENLVLEIKENLRLTTNCTISKSRHILSRKSSRASPYHIPSKYCCDNNNCESSYNKRKIQQNQDQDPYELLQKLLRDGNLVNEAVRRVQLGLTPKQRYFYDESDEDTTSPTMLRLYSQES